jgi:hypothetical protein
MKIGIIDSGVDRKHRRLQQTKIVKEITLDHTDTVQYDATDHCGHGTAVTSIISQMAPSAEFYIAKIFNDQLITKETYLVKAIDWCITNQVDIINLSLGVQTETPSNDLRNICQKAYQKGIIIVSAAHYILSQPCYPAFFSNVFGVTEGRVTAVSEFGVLPDYPIEFVAKGDIHRVAHINNSFKFSSGTSYACAYFTGIVANYKQKLSELKTIDEIKAALVSEANSKVVPTQSKQLTIVPYVIRNDINKVAESLLNKNRLKQDMGRMVLFPVSEKEMNSFLDFPGHSIAPVAKYIDYPRNFSSNKKETIPIQDWMLNETDFQDFDSLVLGYFHEHLLYVNQKYGYELLERAITRQKNIYVFDNKLKRYIERKDVNFQGKVYCPEITETVMQDILCFHNLAKIKTPVIAVVGTSNKQGKFTTQLRLKEILQREGYKVAHLSTEPQSELLGADFTFPIGLNATVKIPLSTWDITINALVKGIAFYTNPHIIISGTQGWIVPLNRSLHNALNMLHFLNGIQPDGIVCAINPNDTPEVIRQNVRAVQSITKASILFYTITPWERTLHQTVTGNKVMVKNLLSEDELQQRIAYYADLLQAPVINIKDINIDKQVVNIIKHFFS